MAQVLAQILIDAEEWTGFTPGAEPSSVVQWRRIHVSHAVPFEQDEVDHDSGIFSHQYFF